LFLNKFTIRNASVIGCVFSIFFLLKMIISPVFAAESLVMPVPDVEPPVIIFDKRDSEIEAGIKTFTAAVDDNVGVAKVTFFYRGMSDVEFKSKVMKRSNTVSNVYTVKLSLSQAVSNKLEFYIRADDVSGNSIFEGQKFEPLIFTVVPRDATGVIQTNTIAKAEPSEDGVFEFYGVAEEEISSNSYNRNLWSKALVMVEGDEQKRKAKYIELRANQLYSQNVGSTGGSNPNEQPLSGNDITGTYISDITSSSSWPSAFDKKSNRELEIIFEQKGNRITGINDSVNLKISGTREGDTIKFLFWGSKLSGYDIKGTWKVNSDGSKLVGTWSNPSGGGQWNLIKIK